MRFRRDEQYMPGAGTTVAWVFDLNSGKQVLVLLYPLDKQHPSKVADGCTHEFTAFEVAATTKIDFDTSIFAQQSLSPLVPGLGGYQFEAETDAMAKARLDDVAADLVNGLLDPFDDECWAVRFRDGERVDMAALTSDMTLEPEKLSA